MQQLHELVLEQPVVVAEVVAEERERLDERAAPDHDLRASVREEVDGRELLEDADRVFGAEDRDGARQPDPLRPHGGGCEHDRRCGDGEVGAVMLPDAEDVEPDLVCEPISWMRFRRRSCGLIAFPLDGSPRSSAKV